jgi:HD-like signal output (HDOD) protein
MAAAAAETRERIDAFMAAGNSRHVAERAVLGVSHAEMGGYLLTLWGFSPVVSQAVAHHHRTWSDGEAPSTVVAAVQVAEALSDRREPDLTALRALGHEAPPAAWTQRIAALGLP